MGIIDSIRNRYNYVLENPSQELFNLDYERERNSTSFADFELLSYPTKQDAEDALVRMKRYLKYYTPASKEMLYIIGLHEERVTKKDKDIWYHSLNNTKVIFNDLLGWCISLEKEN